MAEAQNTPMSADDRNLLITAIEGKLRVTSTQGKPEQIRAWNDTFLSDGRTLENIATELVDKNTVTIKSADGKSEEKSIGEFLKSGDSFDDKFIQGGINLFANKIDWKKDLLEEIKEKQKPHDYTSLANEAVEKVEPAIRKEVADRIKKGIEEQAAKDAKKNGTNVEDERLASLSLLGVTNFDGHEYENLANQLIDDPALKNERIKQGFKDFAQIPDKDQIEKVKKAVGAAVDENTSDFTKSLGLGGASIMNLIAAFFDWISGKGTFTECATKITASSIGNSVKDNLMKDGFSEEDAVRYAEPARKTALNGVKDEGAEIKVAAPVIIPPVAPTTENKAVKDGNPVGSNTENANPAGQSGNKGQPSAVAVGATAGVVASAATSAITPAPATELQKPTANVSITEPVKPNPPEQNVKTNVTPAPVATPPVAEKPKAPPQPSEAREIVEKVVYNMMLEAEKERATDKGEQPNINNINKEQLNEAVKVVMGVVSQDKYKNGLGKSEDLSKDIADAMLANTKIGSNLRQKFNEDDPFGIATIIAHNPLVEDKTAKTNEVIETGEIKVTQKIKVGGGTFLGVAAPAVEKDLSIQKGNKSEGLLSHINVALNNDATGNNKNDIKDLQAAMADFRKSCQDTNNMECSAKDLGAFYSNTGGKQQVAKIGSP